LDIFNRLCHKRHHVEDHQQRKRPVEPHCSPQSRSTAPTHHVHIYSTSDKHMFRAWPAT
jgi:hypothetical protein